MPSGNYDNQNLNPSRTPQQSHSGVYERQQSQQWTYGNTGASYATQLQAYQSQTYGSGIDIGGHSTQSNAVTATSLVAPRIVSTHLTAANVSAAVRPSAQNYTSTTNRGDFDQRNGLADGREATAASALGACLSSQHWRQSQVEQPSHVRYDSSPPPQTLQPSYVHYDSSPPPQTLQPSYVYYDSSPPPQTLQPSYVRYDSSPPPQTLQPSYVRFDSSPPPQMLQPPNHQRVQHRQTYQQTPWQQEAPQTDKGNQFFGQAPTPAASAHGVYPTLILSSNTSEVASGFHQSASVGHSFFQQQHPGYAKQRSVTGLAPPPARIVSGQPRPVQAEGDYMYGQIRVAQQHRRWVSPQLVQSTPTHASFELLQASQRTSYQQQPPERLLSRQGPGNQRSHLQQANQLNTQQQERERERLDQQQQQLEQQLRREEQWREEKRRENLRSKGEQRLEAQLQEASKQEQMRQATEGRRGWERQSNIQSQQPPSSVSGNSGRDSWNTRSPHQPRGPPEILLPQQDQECRQYRMYQYPQQPRPQQQLAWQFHHQMPVRAADFASTSVPSTKTVAREPGFEPQTQHLGWGQHPQPQQQTQEQQYNMGTYQPTTEQTPMIPGLDGEGQIDRAEMERRMRGLVETMKMYQSKDPSVFNSIWANMRKETARPTATTSGGEPSRNMPIGISTRQSIPAAKPVVQQQNQTGSQGLTAAESAASAHPRQQESYLPSSAPIQTRAPLPQPSQSPLIRENTYSTRQTVRQLQSTNPPLGAPQPHTIAAPPISSQSDARFDSLRHEFDKSKLARFIVDAVNRQQTKPDDAVVLAPSAPAAPSRGTAGPGRVLGEVEDYQEQLRDESNSAMKSSPQQPPRDASSQIHHTSRVIPPQTPYVTTPNRPSVPADPTNTPSQVKRDRRKPVSDGKPPGCAYTSAPKASTVERTSLTSTIVAAYAPVPGAAPAPPPVLPSATSFQTPDQQTPSQNASSFFSMLPRSSAHPPLASSSQKPLLNEFSAMEIHNSPPQEGFEIPAPVQIPPSNSYFLIEDSPSSRAQFQSLDPLAPDLGPETPQIQGVRKSALSGSAISESKPVKWKKTVVPSAIATTDESCTKYTKGSVVIDMTTTNDTASPSASMTENPEKSKEPLAGKIQSKKAARVSKYDPREIARYILIVTQNHPTERPLNAHLLPLKDNLPGKINWNSDLETIRWDILDPGPVAADGDVDMDDDEGDGINSLALQNEFGDSPMLKKKGRAPGNPTRQATPKSLFGDQTAPRSAPSHATTSRRFDNHTPSVVDLISSRSQTLELPRAAMVASPSSKRRRIDQPIQGTQESPGAHTSPIFKKYCCRWNDCTTDLHNVDNLKRHIDKRHKKKDNSNRGYLCQWAGCSQQPTSEKTNVAEGNGIKIQPMIWNFASEGDWGKHVDSHIDAVRQAFGVGPAALLSDRESGASDIDYLSDYKGYPVTPLARPSNPFHKFLPPLGFKANKQFNVAHDITARNKQTVTESYRRALGRARSLGAGMEGDEVGELLTLDDGTGIHEEVKRIVPADWPLLEH